MEVLYVVKYDPNIPNYEPLRYSLRSIDKYADGVDQVYVVGNPPPWLSTKAKTLKVNDETAEGKHWNILNCIAKAVEHFGLHHDFLYSSDDHFLLSGVDFDAFPYFAKGRLYSYFEYMQSKGKEPGKYQKAIIATRRLLEERKHDLTMACCHRNTHMDGRYLGEVLELANDARDYTNYGFEPSCLFNAVRQKMNPVKYENITQTQDEKVRNVNDIIEKRNRGDVFMSTNPAAELKVAVMNWMRNEYSVRSKWER